jgi:hypothetical protein
MSSANKVYGQQQRWLSVGKETVDSCEAAAFEVAISLQSGIPCSRSAADFAAVTVVTGLQPALTATWRT